MTLKVILGGPLDVIFLSFEVQKPGTGDRDVYLWAVFIPFLSCPFYSSNGWANFEVITQKTQKLALGRHKKYLGRDIISSFLLVMLFKKTLLLFPQNVYGITFCLSPCSKRSPRYIPHNHGITF